jgi:hypothetical protein
MVDGPGITVSRMPEEKQDPASTQMFRAFVDRGDPSGGRKRMLPAVLLLVAAIVIAIVTVVLIVN